jgi:hypothetical protein
VAVEVERKAALADLVAGEVGPVTLGAVVTRPAGSTSRDRSWRPSRLPQRCSADRIDRRGPAGGRACSRPRAPGPATRRVRASICARASRPAWHLPSASAGAGSGAGSAAGRASPPLGLQPIELLGGFLALRARLGRHQGIDLGQHRRIAFSPAGARSRRARVGALRTVLAAQLLSKLIGGRSRSRSRIWHTASAGVGRCGLQASAAATQGRGELGGEGLPARGSSGLIRFRFVATPISYGRRRPRRCGSPAVVAAPWVSTPSAGSRRREFPRARSPPCPMCCTIAASGTSPSASSASKATIEHWLLLLVPRGDVLDVADGHLEGFRAR